VSHLERDALVREIHPQSAKPRVGQAGRERARVRESERARQSETERAREREARERQQVTSPSSEREREVDLAEGLGGTSNFSPSSVRYTPGPKPIQGNRIPLFRGCGSGSTLQPKFSDASLVQWYAHCLGCGRPGVRI